MMKGMYVYKHCMNLVGYTKQLIVHVQWYGM